jgi:hypothetical protein
MAYHVRKAVAEYPARHRGKAVPDENRDHPRRHDHGDGPVPLPERHVREIEHSHAYPSEDEALRAAQAEEDEADP